MEMDGLPVTLKLPADNWDMKPVVNIYSIIIVSILSAHSVVFI